MAVIWVDKDGLANDIANMDSYISQLETLNSRLSSLIARIDDSWDGAAAEAYVQKMNQRLSKAQSMVGILRSYRNYMSTARRNYADKDSLHSSKIKA